MMTTKIQSAGFQAVLINKIPNVSISIAYWYNDSQSGYKNTVIPAGDSWEIEAQPGDAYSWAQGEGVPPNDAPRFPVNPGENPIPPQ